MHAPHRATEIKVRYPPADGDTITTSSNVVAYMVSDVVQVIYTLDVSALLRICPTQNLLHSTNVLIAIPTLVQNIKVKITSVLHSRHSNSPHMLSLNRTSYISR